MTQLKIALLFIFLLSFTNCEKIVEKKKDVNSKQHKTISGSYFENEEANILNSKGVEFSREGYFRKGREAFLEANKLEPNNPTILSNLGLNSFMLRNYDIAIEYYQRAYEISDSTYHVAAINLGVTYYYKEEFDKGIEITDYVINNTDDVSVLSSAYVHRALNYIGKDECKNAKSDLKYIKNHYGKVENMDYHIKDLTDKLKACITE